ncbi:nSTAND1 domain-containing NTPase [Kamptonema formosum]|uniref:nSTAND1 domain-containing NTPase n=1 Tax=Kamptonema formosum TaxID=331992 RepID=UPI00034CE360|nr:caspase family protein [Oscillatoria sp. PCC 10802]
MSPVSVRTSQSAQGLKTGQAKLWILLVGANHYQDESLPSLEYSALDCQGLGEALAEATLAFPQKQLIIHHDFAELPPRLEAVHNSLKQIVSAAKAQDTVLFYFSGHGLLDRESQQAILCLQDTQKDDPLNTGLSLPELLNLLGNCKASQQLIWLDACHSGSMMLRGQPVERSDSAQSSGSMLAGSRGEREAEINPGASLLNPSSQLVDVLQKRAAQSQGFYALLSCDRTQRSWEFPQLGHGVFTYYLMRGLLGEAADQQGVIDADGLYKYVYHKTLQYIDKTNQQLRLINQQKRSRGETKLYPEYPLQTPKRIVEGVGELILGLKPTSANLNPSRLAVVVEGLSGGENSLALSKLLRQAGNFQLEYWHRHARTHSEVRAAIQNCLRSHVAVAGESQSEAESRHTPAVADTETALLYFRGRIERTLEGEVWMVLSEEVRLSSSWLRQELRRSQTAQQIVILDCPGASSLSDWLEDLQLKPEGGQLLIAAAAPAENPERFAQALLETLQTADRQVGLPVAGWISRLQINLAGTGISLHIWLSGAKGVIEVIPGKIGWREGETAAGDVGVCPYMGLQAFEEEDAQFFYGRETLTQHLVSELNRRAFLAVVGASGSGKSSVVHAGLIAQLQQGVQLPGSDSWWVESFRPGARPLQALSCRLAGAGTEEERAREQMQLEGMLYQGVEGFVCWLRSRPEPMVVLVADQFEEVFTLATASDRQVFLDILLGALDSAGDRFKLVLVLRADFITSCLEVPALVGLLQQSSILVPPYLTADDYRRAIVKPAEKVGLKVEPALVNVLLQELNRSPGDLPVLQFVLEQLWDCRQGGELTLEAYHQKIGGLQGALERKAQAVYDSLDAEARDCAQWIFLALTQLGEGKEDTRRRAFKSELAVRKYSPDLVEKTLQALTAAKLIVMSAESEEAVVGSSRDADATPVEPEDQILQKMKQEVTVEVAHEILIRHWSTLRWWLEENRDRLRVQRQLAQSALQWKQNGRQSDFLLPGVRLEEAEDMYVHYTDELSEDVLLFVAACLEEKKRQQFEDRRRLRQARTAVAVISVLAVGALGLGGFAFQQSLKTKLEEIKALNPLSENNFLLHKQLDALAAGVKAGRQIERMKRFGNLLVSVPEDTQGETVRVLEKVVYDIQERNRLEGHSDEVYSVAFSPDDQMIASASRDKTVRLWASNGQVIRTLTGHSAGVWGVSFSPDSKIVASASGDTTIKLWNTSDGKLLITLTGHTKGVNSVSFSRDGQIIVSASADQTIKLWRTSDGNLIRTLEGHDGYVNSARFSPDSQTIISASDDGTIKLWRTGDGKLIKTLKGHSSWVKSASFSPDGQLIASAGADKTVRLWRSSDGSPVRIMTGHTDEVNSVRFSCDGQILVSASRDRTVKLWKISDSSPLSTFEGHSAEVRDASFSPDGQTIASASMDTTIKLWKMIDNFSVRHGKKVYSVSFSPDSREFASASQDNTIKLWSRDGKPLRTLQGHAGAVYRVSFSRDGNTLASGSADNTVKLWSRDGSLLRTLWGHSAGVNSVSFSHDGQMVASASNDKTVKLWRTKDGYLLHTFLVNSPVKSVSFSRDGKTIASASNDGKVKLWSRDGRLLNTLRGHSERVNSVSFSPDGNTLVSGSDDKTVKLWRMSDGHQLQSFSEPKNIVWDARFSPDGKTLASADEDGKVYLWRINDGKLLRTFSSGYQAGVISISFSPDGKKFATASLNDTVKIWNIDTAQLQPLELDSLLRRACDWLGDYLQTNPKVSPEDRQLCSGLIANRSPQ